MHRHVKGSLFADYVRMVRSRKDVDWSRHLSPEDMGFVLRQVDLEAWYPMETFERLGNGILAETAGGELARVRLWGRLSAGPLHERYPTLVAPRDPVETLMRFRTLRSAFFDFPALDIPMLLRDQAHVEIRFHMGPAAEEAASFQTMGFCEGVLALAEADDIRAEFDERSWAGDPRTRLHLFWSPPR